MVTEMSSFSGEVRSNGRRARIAIASFLLTIMCAGTAHMSTGCAPKPHTPAPDDGPESDDKSTGERFPVTIRKPAGPPTIKTGAFDDKGNPITIACATCHTTKPANTDAKLGTALTLFHQGLVGKHANLSCVSCHNAADGYGTLRLADGKSLPYSEVMTLCAQCHGPQFRDYQHGAHGGMNGHWDLSKGPRVRNNCIDCHDPHAPKYPTVAPALGPHDRFLNKDGHD
jgi:formate-dependent nitrite reductase cytochrome c552 subunit